MIFLEKVNFQMFCSAVISSEGLTLDGFRALLRHNNFHGKGRNSKHVPPPRGGWTRPGRMTHFQKQIFLIFFRKCRDVPNNVGDVSGGSRGIKNFFMIFEKKNKKFLDPKKSGGGRMGEGPA